MCPTSSSEAPSLLRRRSRLPGTSSIETALTGVGLDVAERAEDPGVLTEALAQVQTLLSVPVVRMHQVHGTTVHHVRSADEPVVEADALVTTTPGVALMARSADCVPVLLADVSGSVVGAVHAGRVGFAAGVVPATVATMRDLGAGDLVALVGPAICGACYEVPAAMRDEVAAVEPAAAATTRWGTPALDLPQAVTAQLRADGVVVESDGSCTYEDASTWSHRRQGAAAGRMGALIWRTA